MHKNDGHLSWLIALVAALAAISLYLPSMHYGFINWDDSVYIYDNQHLKVPSIDFLKWAFTTFHNAYWQPLIWISYSLDYAIWGLNPTGYHFTNILIHGLNTFLVIILTNRLFRFALVESYNLKAVLFASSLTGIIFGLHPLRVESVIWISERKDVLYAFFYLLSIHFYLSYTASKSSRMMLFYSLCLFSFAFSLMSKPMGITMPIVLFILDHYPLRRVLKGNTFKIILEKVPFAIFAILSTILTMLSAQKSFTKEIYTFWEMLLVFIRAILFYLIKMFLPFNLSPLYPMPLKIPVLSLEYIGPLFIFTCITIVFFKIRKKMPVFFAAWAYYITALLPAVGTTQAGIKLEAADRFTYLPLLGPLILLSAGAMMLWNKQNIKQKVSRVHLVFAAIIILIILSTLTLKQMQLWKDPKRFWSYITKTFPGSYLPSEFKGHAYLELGWCDEAMKEMGQIGIFNPAFAEKHNRHGVWNLSKAYETAIKIKPELVNEPGLLGIIRGIGAIPEARELIEKAACSFKAAIMINPDYADAQHNLGITYTVLGMDDLAIEKYMTAIKLNSSYPDAHYNLAILYIEKGVIEKAQKELKMVLNLKPDDHDAQALLNKISK